MTKNKNMIKKHLIEHLEPVLKVIIPAAKFTVTDCRIGDVYGASGNSLSICLVGKKRGIWYDHATNTGGTIVDFIAEHFGLNPKTEIELLFAKVEALLAIADKKNFAVPLAINKFLPKFEEKLIKVAEWEYLNLDGSYNWSVLRFEDSKGKKSIRPYNKTTKSNKAHPGPRPLYNLPGIHISEIVIIVEGEKCATALIGEGYCATTAMMGANAPSSKTDWSPLKDKEVLIWPDNDAVGKEYAINCAEAALAAGAKSCAIFKLPEGMPEGWDVADALTSTPAFDVYTFIKFGEILPIIKTNHSLLFEAFSMMECPTEDGIAAILSGVYGADWKYCAGWGKWFSWDGNHWMVDANLVFNYKVREVCRVAAVHVNDTKQNLIAKIASAATVSNVERLARADPIHATSVDIWDAEPMLLNTSGGIINLTTGELSPHQRNKFLTKIVNAKPHGNCPLWLDFLTVITDGDNQLIAYLQRVIGYGLTGLTTEHALFFLYGTGANGKSVFLNVISSILGDYAKTAPMETFMDTRSDRHPTDLAGLRGARFVCAIETEQGRRWNESKIKAITGGDTISARLMRQDFFEFKPQFKLLIAGNHKPSISNVDEAMSRRIHLIPFTVYIPPEKRDKHLTSKLLKECDGILAWAVQGLMQWHKLGGLHPPEIVTKATQEYLDAEDAVGRWLEDCCDTDSSAFTSSKWLFESWKHWADEYGEYVGSNRKLSDKLIARKFESCRQNQVRGFKGIQIIDNFVFHNQLPIPPTKGNDSLESQL